MSEAKWVKVAGGGPAVERSTCGFRQRILKKDDGAPASISRLRIDNAQPHYHTHTHEYYYVLGGQGQLIIDGESIPIEAGDCVWIKPGATHHAEGDIESLVIAIPAYDPADTFLAGSGAVPGAQL